MEASGYTGPYPSEAAAESHSELEGPSPGASEAETSGSATEAGPSLPSEGHSELERSSPTPAGGDVASATAAPPVVAATIAASPSLTTLGGLFGIGQASAGYSSPIPTLPPAPIEALGTQLAGVASTGRPEQASAGYTGALPNVAKTAYPASYGPGVVYPS